MLVVKFIPLMFMIGIMVIVAFWLYRRPDIHPDYLFQDVIDFNNTGRPYLGFFSYFGPIFWLTSAAICSFAAAIRWRLGAPDRQRSMYLALLGFGSAWLGFDDLYLFHESLAVRYLHLSENFILALYAIGVVIIFILSFGEILRRERLFLIISIGLLGASQCIDIINTQQALLKGDRLWILSEDILQTVGIFAFWLYSVQISFSAVIAVYLGEIGQYSGSILSSSLIVMLPKYTAIAKNSINHHILAHWWGSKAHSSQEQDGIGTTQSP